MGVPNLEFDWELGLFKALRHLWRQFRPTPDLTPLPHVAQLRDHLPGLTILAQLVAQAPLQLLPARDVGGIRGRDLLLPTQIALSSDGEINRGMYVVRVALAAAMYRQLHERATKETLPTYTWLGALQLAWDAAQQLEVELPSFGPAFREGLLLCLAGRPALEPLRGQVRQIEEARRATLRGEKPWEDKYISEMLGTIASRDVSGPGIPLMGEWIQWQMGDDHVEPGPGEQTRPPAGREALARVVEEIRRITLDPRDEDRATITHTFEKAETADSYKGGNRDTDGSDELDQHLEALEEVDLSEVIREGAPAQSLLRAEIGNMGEIPDVGEVLPNERGIPYPEWDHLHHRYRPDWCVVYPTPVFGGDGAAAAAAERRHRPLILDLERRIQIYRTRRERCTRQRQGQEVDLSALVDHFAEVHAGRSGDDRLYIQNLRRQREFATTVLLDVSLSSDAWVDGRRVLDVSREAVLVLGELAHRLGDKLQVLAFASHTRHHNRVWELAAWNQPWIQARGRLFALRPQGYTRIGPALRHGISELNNVGTQHRILLLVSDGKPTDYDRYEGSYGNSDVHQAIREAHDAGIVPHVLAVDNHARSYLPAMFGAGSWHLLPRPDALPEALATLYGRLTRR